MIRVIEVDDFTGGLNLQANVLQLENNESVDMLNVDLNPKGGFQRRNGCVRRNTSAIGSYALGTFSPQKLFPWFAEQGKYLMLSTSDKVFYSTTGNFTDLGLSSDAISGSEFASWTDDNTSNLYISCGYTYQTRRWNATTLTALTASGTGAWQNDLTNPNGTHAPKCQHVTTHADRLWVANTNENGSNYPNRVRFSHPLFPESWREDDYIDVIGGGSGITAIVPFSGFLLVFKPRSVFAIYGYSDDTFQLVELSRSVGAVNSKAVVTSDQGVYFFSYPEGVYFYDGVSIRDIFFNLRSLITDAEINEEALSTLSMGYANKKVFVSLPTGVAEGSSATYDDSSVLYNQSDRKYAGTVRASTPTISFVFNELVDKGAWSVYRTADGYGFINPVYYLDTNGVTHNCAAHPYQPYVFDFDVPNIYTDNFLGSPIAYDSYYYTPWMEGENASSYKVWRRPNFTVRREANAVSVGVEVYHNYNPIDIEKTFNIEIEDTDTVVGDGWNPAELGSTIISGNGLGFARSVQLKIYNNSGFPWSVDGITYKYSPRSIKT